jgi:hypothetical protein
MKHKSQAKLIFSVMNLDLFKLPLKADKMSQFDIKSNPVSEAWVFYPIYQIKALID